MPFVADEVTYVARNRTTGEILECGDLAVLLRRIAISLVAVGDTPAWTLERRVDPAP